MNERIKQLERESGLDVYSLGLDKAKWESKLEKFAELVVDKCIEQCKKHDHEPSVDKKSNEVDYAESRTARHCAGSIRWYFGIEQ